MKVALIAEHASPLATDDGLGGADGGGQNVFVAGLARTLGRQGHQVTVFTRRADPNVADRVPLAPDVPDVMVEHVPAGPPRAIPKDDLLAWMPDFGRYLARRWIDDTPDVAHAHFWMSGLATLAAVAGTQIPVVQTYHGLGTVKRRHLADRDTSPPERIRLEQAIGRTVDAVIATCSDETSELIRMGVRRPRISVVPFGVDLDTFRPEEPAERRTHRLVVLSRLVERKGIETAIDALPRVPGTELLIAGGPPREGIDTDIEVNRLRLRAERSGVARRVRFLGRIGQPQVPRLLRSADLVVTLPWYEPFGMVPLEAMACGVPVIASGVGGHLDTIVDQNTGLHVPPRRPTEAGDRIRELLEDPVRREAMGIMAADRARALYSWDRIGRHIVDVYEGALERIGARS